MSQSPSLLHVWRRCSSATSGMHPQARARLGLSVALLAGIWSLEIAPARFDGAPLAEGLLAMAVLVLGHEVLAGGFASSILYLRVTQDGLAALAAMIGCAMSFLLSAVDAAGRLSPFLQDSRGGPLLLFAPAATIILARLAGREIASTIISAPVCTLCPRASHVTKPEARLAAISSLGMAASAAVALGMAVPMAVLSGGFAAAAPALMAVLAGISPEVIPLILYLARLRAGALLPEEDPQHSLEVLERASRVDTVIFEKSGVLTACRPEVTGVRALTESWSREDILHLAAVAEYGVHHPIREAVLRSYKANLRTVPNLKDIQHLPGRGIRASYQGRELCLGNLSLFQEGDWPREAVSRIEKRAREGASGGETVLFLSLAREIIGALSLRDPLRPECKDALDRLRAMRIRMVVLSGDPHPALGLPPDGPPVEMQAGVLLEKRHEVLEALEREGRAVAVVGTRGFLGTWAGAADLCFLWPEGGSRRSAGVPPCEVPAGKSFFLPRRDLLEVPGRIALGKGLARLRRKGLGLLGLHHFLILPAVAGGLEPWTGIGPCPALAAILAALLPAGILIACGGPPRKRLV